MKREKASRVIWGILLLVGAAVLLAYNMGAITTDKLNPFNIIAGTLLLGCLIHSLIKLSFPGMLYSLAFLCIVFSDILGLGKITPWPVLIAATLGSIGLSLIFPNVKRGYTVNIEGKDGKIATDYIKDTVDGEYISFSNSFSGVAKYIDSQNLKVVNAECKFCGMEIYFDNAKIPSGTAVLNLKASFSGVEIHVPKDWRIVNNIQTSLGGVDEGDNKGTEEKTGPQLIINGSAELSGVDIIYGK